jgi:iron complex transport system substrate-binding protein
VQSSKDVSRGLRVDHASSRSYRLKNNPRAWFDTLTTNGSFSRLSVFYPFVLSPSKDGHHAFRRPTQLPLLVLVALLASVQVAGAEPLVVRDDLGQTLRFDRPPQRIVSLSPALTEILFALGLDESIVGVSDFCNYPDAALTKPRVGGLAPNLEAIVALKPDLVVTTGGVAMRDTARRLGRLHIPLMGVEPVSVDSILARITLLGEATGRREAAATLVDDSRRRLAAVAARRSAAPSPRVLYLIDDEPLITVGPRSYLYDVLVIAGARPFETGPNESYPRIGMEAVVRFDPEVIFFGGDSADKAAAHAARWQRWTRIAAVKTGRLYAIPRDLVNRPGPRIVEAVEFIETRVSLVAHGGSPAP